MGNFFSSDTYHYEDALLNNLHKTKPLAVAVDNIEPDTGFSKIYRNVQSPDELIESVKYGDKTISTMWELYEHGYTFTDGEGEFLGTRSYTVESNPEKQASAENLVGKSKNYKPSGYVEHPDGAVVRGEYIWVTYKEAREAALNLGRGLKLLGADPLSHVGIFSANRAEWTIASMGCYSQNITVTPLYATLGHDSTEYIIKHAEIGILICSFENLPLITKIAPRVKGVLKSVVVIDCILDGRFGNTLDKVKQSQIDAFAEHDIQLYGYSEVMKNGTSIAEDPLVLPTKEDVAFLMYTSGTTGVPKGVTLTHRNILSVVASVQLTYPIFNKDDVYASFLPLGHILETLGCCVIIINGGKIGFSQGDIRRLGDDLTKINPCLFPAVPRIIERFYQGVWNEVGKELFPIRWLVNHAFNSQIQQIRSNQPLDSFYDSKIFEGIRKKIGLGRVKLVLTGAAPCPPHLVEFMRVITNAYFVQGYGMTECAAGCAIQTLDEPTIPHCGPPLHCNQIMLADLKEEMDYSIHDKYPRGELLISGPNIFEGYYKDETSTSESLYIDSHGIKWYRSGDVARINPNGTVSIIDRKKNIIKLSQGEYVGLEKVEQLLGSAPGIAQLWVYGSAYKSMLVGLIVPDAKYIYDLAVKNGWWKDPEVKPSIGNLSDKFIEEYARVIKEHTDELKTLYAANIKTVDGTLVGFEKIKTFEFETAIDAMGLAFNEANNTLTPTLKKRRKQLVDKYIDTLKHMYESLGEPPKEGEKW